MTKVFRSKSRFVWEKEAHNKSNVLVQARHLCWSMSVKSSIGGCLSNAVVKVSCNCSERTFNMAVIKYLRNDTFEKKLPKQRHKSFWSNCPLIKLFLNKKWKYNTMVPSYHSKVTSTQNKGVPFFSCLAHRV